MQMGNAGGDCLRAGLLLAKAAMVTVDVQDNGGGAEDSHLPPPGIRVQFYNS